MTDLKPTDSTFAIAAQRQPSVWTRVRRSQWMNHAGLFIVVLLVFAATAFGSDAFLKPTTLANTAEQVSWLAVIAAGLTLLMTAGGVDFSLGGIAGVGSAILGQLISGGTDPVLAVVIMLVVATLIGALNGVIVTFIGVEPFVVTLATATILAGAQVAVLGGGRSAKTGDTFTWLHNGDLFGMPYLVILAIIVMLIIGLMMRYTVFGRNVFAIGGNEEVAKLSGIPISRVKMLLYTLNGLLAGIAGIMLLANVGTASTSLGGLNLELQAVAAVVIGGTALAGGYGTMIGTVLGVMLLGLVGKALGLLSVDSSFQQVSVGAVLLIAAIVGHLQKRRR
ncbi:MAG: ABC transporter permease [Microbacterium sp.]|uniref:ABC transporter permease n=1 Tax=Microbacterium sp. TaxID=51671 RepID=UPI0039E40A0E